MNNEKTETFKRCILSHLRKPGQSLRELSAWRVVGFGNLQKSLDAALPIRNGVWGDSDAVRQSDKLFVWSILMPLHCQLPPTHELNWTVLGGWLHWMHFQQQKAPFSNWFQWSVSHAAYLIWVCEISEQLLYSFFSCYPVKKEQKDRCSLLNTWEKWRNLFILLLIYSPIWWSIRKHHVCMFSSRSRSSPVADLNIKHTIYAVVSTSFQLPAAAGKGHGKCDEY